MIDPRVYEEVKRRERESQLPQPSITPQAAAPEVPSYQKKKFFETGPLDDLVSRASSRVGGDETIARLRSGRTKSDPGPYTAAVDQLLNMGLGGMTPNQIAQRGKTDAAFLEQYGLGKAFSYEDLAKEALQSDPFYDPANTAAISSFAQDLEKRGLSNTQREEIKTLATQYSVKDQIERATNPGKFLDETKKAENLETAGRLLKQNYGEDTNDPDLQQFLADRLAEGESAFEVSQFLQTTPQYLKKQADAENQKVQTESTAAREALNQELLKSQQEVFARAQPSIISSFMRAGRLGSSGLNSALAQAQADLERERQSFLGNAAYSDAIRAQGYKREDFVGANNAAFQQYLRQNEPAYQQRLNVQNAGNYATFQRPWENLNRQYQLSDQARARQWEIEDYNRQQSDYNRYLSDQRRSDRQNLPWQLLGQLGGAAIQGWAMRGR